MKQAGFDVRIARDGDAALRMIESDIPDLVLLDIMMPRRDGYEVCRAIRSNPDWRDMRIVVLTAKGREFDRQKSLALGADDFVTKPFSTRDIVQRVSKALGTERP